MCLYELNYLSAVVCTRIILCRTSIENIVTIDVYLLAKITPQNR